MRKKTLLKTGVYSLILGIALVSLSFIKGFKADSITETMSEGVILMRVAVILGVVCIALAAGCIAVAISTEK